MNGKIFWTRLLYNTPHELLLLLLLHVTHLHFRLHCILISFIRITTTTRIDLHSRRFLFQLFHRLLRDRFIQRLILGRRRHLDLIITFFVLFSLDYTVRQQEFRLVHGQELSLQVLFGSDARRLGHFTANGQFGLMEGVIVALEYPGPGPKEASVRAQDAGAGRHGRWDERVAIRHGCDRLPPPNLLSVGGLVIARVWFWK